MSLSQKPTPLIVSNQMSLRDEPWTCSTSPDSDAWEDGCTVRRPPLRLSDPGIWCVGGLIAAVTAWIMT
jgi:hypothetical protein